MAIWRISEGLQDSPPSEWRVFDRAARQVGSVTATGFAWAGPDTYVVSRTAGDDTMAEWSVRLGSTTETHTASVPIAFEPEMPCIAADWNGSFTAWLGGAESQPISGHAMACSADGSEIALIKLRDGEGISGSLEVVRAATGSLLWSLPAIELSGTSPVAFSSDGLHLLAGESIVDLQSGSAASLPITSVESGAWLSNGKVAVISLGADRVRAFDVAGKEAPIDLPSGRYLSVSPAGAMAVIDDLAGTLHIVSSGAGENLELDCTPRSFLYWSPDGRQLVVSCDLAGSGEKALLVAVP